jgi:hypothetical protein
LPHNARDLRHGLRAIGNVLDNQRHDRNIKFVITKRQGHCITHTQVHAARPWFAFG